MQKAKTELIIALDYAADGPVRNLLTQLEGLPVIYKVGLELFIAKGPDFIKELIQKKTRIFLDLKLHDIPHTVAKAVKQVSELGVEMTTLHITGGKKMVQAAQNELAADCLVKLLGVTVLTSFDDQGWGEVLSAATNQSLPKVNTGSSALALASQAAEWKMGGIVCSAHELPSIRAKNPGLYAVVPGIRPSGVAAGDQSRIMTPQDAVSAGASALVIGRPITESADPRKAAEQILREIASAEK